MIWSQINAGMAVVKELHRLWECLVVNPFWSVMTNALREILQVNVPWYMLGDEIDGLPVRKVRCVTLGCLAAEWQIELIHELEGKNS